MELLRRVGVGMAHGRAFVEADSQGDGNQIVLSYGLWRRRFGGRPDVINSTTTLDGRAVTIVGVASAELNFPATAQFWQPLIFTPRDLSPESRGAQWVQVLARLKIAVSPQQATTALQTVGRNLAREFPRTENDVTALAIPLHERIVGNIRPTLFALLGAVMLVLLIACANVASLLLARAQARDREVAVRVALGATRRQLMAQLLTESLVLGMLGAAAGVGMAILLVRALVLLGPASIPRLATLTVDVNVLAFAVGVAIATSIAFGLTPAVLVSGRSTNRSFALSSRGAVGKSTTGARRLLVVSELAFAAMLLVSSGLLIRSYLQLQRVEPGFDPEGVATFGLSLPAAKYPAPANLDAFVSTLLSRLEAEPGVESAAVAFGLPFTSGLNVITGFRREDQAEPESASMPSASMRIVSADYFRTMRIPIRSGRLFDRRDTATAPEVVLINERTAQRYFAGLNPVGQQIRVTAQVARHVRNGPKTSRRHRRQRQIPRPRRGHARRNLFAVRPTPGGCVYRGGAHDGGSARHYSLAAPRCRWTRSVVAAGQHQFARFTRGRIDRRTSIHHGRVSIVCRHCCHALRYWRLQRAGVPGQPADEGNRFTPCDRRIAVRCGLALRPRRHGPDGGRAYCRISRRGGSGPMDSVAPFRCHAG